MTRLELPKCLFEREETHLLSHGDFKISTFRYPSGIEALRVTSKRAEIIVLPFKGQQIWRASFDGVDVTMKSFTHHYLARSEISLDPSEASIGVSLDVENRRKAPMDLMYLGHANFRPVEGGELVYSAPYTPEAVRVRTSVPSHISVPEGYMDFIAELEVDPSKHHLMDPSRPFDPEIVFSIDMLGDDSGWAHALQTHPDGSADFISYDAQTCPLAGRWVCWMDDQQGLGIAFPATSGVEGRRGQKQKQISKRISGRKYETVYQ